MISARIITGAKLKKGNLSMHRFILLLILSLMFITAAHAGIDESINNLTKPIAVLIGQIVFFKIPIFGAQLPVVVLGLLLVLYFLRSIWVS